MTPTTNRLQPLQLAAPSGRTAPQRDFGQSLSQAVGVISNVADLSMRAALPSGVLSGVTFATGAVQQVSALAASAPAPIRPLPGTQTSVGAAIPGHAGPNPGSMGGSELVETQRLMQLESFAFNQQYLQLQNEMQRESRQFTAVSNVMKVRHDSAKASINNVR